MELALGKRVRYVGHGPGCTSCGKPPVSAPPAPPAKREGLLDDRDTFGGSGDPTWDDRVGRAGYIDKINVYDDCVWVKLDEERGTLNIYVSHLMEE